MSRYPIFISYKRADYRQVLSIKEFIEKNTGVRCFMDIECISSGAPFDEIISTAIKGCEIFLFCYSKETNQEEDWTIRELVFAENLHKKIVILNLDDSDLTPRMQFLYGNRIKIDARDEESLQKMVEDIRGLLQD